jgi:phosphatidylserine decarboxylase
MLAYVLCLAGTGILALVVALECIILRSLPSWSTVLYGVLPAAAAFLLLLLRSTLQFAKSARPFCVARTGAIDQEVRPVSDGVFHVLLFIWRIFGTGVLQQHLLLKLNSGYDDWDTPFDELGKDAATAVREYCERYGVQQKPWIWSKPPGDYTTMNEWFTRKYSAASGLAPEDCLGDAAVVTPATAVVGWFESVAVMPQMVKNEQFTMSGCGVPDEQAYMAHPCAILYLAPVDYHCYHAPISGRVTCCQMLGGSRHSVSVKPYIFSHMNILACNRRAVIVIEAPNGLRVAMVAIGGVTVDSIRLDAAVREGTTLRRGQLIGAFARGGSSIALFFARPVVLVEQCRALIAKGMDFKLDVGANLAELPVGN